MVGTVLAAVTRLLRPINSMLQRIYTYLGNNICTITKEEVGDEACASQNNIHSRKEVATIDHLRRY